MVIIITGQALKLGLQHVYKIFKFFTFLNGPSK